MHTKLCPTFSLDPGPLWLVLQILAPAEGRTESPDRLLRIPVSHDWRRVYLSFFLVHQTFWAWWRSRFQQPIRGLMGLLTTKLICSKSHFRVAALSAPMMLLCRSFASASFASRNPLSLFVDCLNSKIYTICRASLIATPSGCLPQKRFTKKDTGLKLYCVSWLCLTGIVTSISCAFSARSSLLQIIRNFSRRHSMLILLSLSSVTNLSLLFGFFAACMLSYRCLDSDGVVSSRNCYCYPFATCTDDVTVCFGSQTVSALTSGLSRYFAQPTPCWLSFA